MMLNDDALACTRGVRPPPLPHHIDLSIANLAVRVVSPDWNIAVSFSSIAPHHKPQPPRTQNGDDPSPVHAGICSDPGSVGDDDDVIVISWVYEYV